ncbi:STAS domain-containing protein [Streptomyces sp. NPDC055051]|uniref:STAS domain-containing protein n=1 Tax=Streptomyces sp. NPDC014861 TaxID=3364923 RepID=UPI0036FC64A0
MNHPDPTFELKAVATPDGVLRMTLTGELAWDSAEELLDAARPHLVPGRSHPGPDAAPTDLHVDCSGLTLCDSMGLSALLTLHRLAAAAGARLHLDDRPPLLDRLLLLTGTYEHLTGRSESAGPDGDTPSGTAEHPRPVGP